MHNEPSVSVQIVVHNGERFIRHCLYAVRAQTYGAIAVTVLDNASTDGTATIVEREYPEFRCIRFHENLGMWPGHEHLLRHTQGEFVLALSADVILSHDFIERAVHICRRDVTVSAVQGKFYQYDISELERYGISSLRRDVLDTCGFALSRSRKVINLGHGQRDGADFSGVYEIFGVEGAAPFFRRSALENCRMNGVLWDPDYFWYGDDLDMAWRMHLFGHRQVFVADAVAWHDRATTKGASPDILGHFSRISSRRSIPLMKRRLDWSNVRFTIIKNDSSMNILRDVLWIALREIATFLYTLVFEPGVFAEAGRFFRLLPRMLRRRHEVLARAVTPPSHMRQWFR